MENKKNLAAPCGLYCGVWCATPDQEWTHVSGRDGPSPKLHVFELGRR